MTTYNPNQVKVSINGVNITGLQNIELPPMQAKVTQTKQGMETGDMAVGISPNTGYMLRLTFLKHSPSLAFMETLFREFQRLGVYGTFVVAEYGSGPGKFVYTGVDSFPDEQPNYNLPSDGQPPDLVYTISCKQLLKTVT